MSLKKRISCWLLLKIILRSNVQQALLRVCLLLMVVIFRWQGGSVTASDGNAIGSGSLTVDGTGDGVTGSIVEVVSGNYALIDGTTLTGNTTTGNGGAINNAAGANVYLLGGTITANSAAAGGAIYSEGTVNIRGTVSVTGNTVTNSFEAASNLVLAKDGVINVSGAVTGSAIGVAVQEANAGEQS